MTSNTMKNFIVSWFLPEILALKFQVTETKKVCNSITLVDMVSWYDFFLPNTWSKIDNLNWKKKKKKTSK